MRKARFTEHQIIAVIKSVEAIFYIFILFKWHLNNKLVCLAQMDKRGGKEAHL